MPTSSVSPVRGLCQTVPITLHMVASGDMVSEAMRPKIGSTYWAKEVLDHVTHHVEQERGLLEEYTRVAEDTESKALAYLVHILARG